MSDCPFPLVDEMWNLNVVRREIAKLFYIVKRMGFFAQFHKNSSFEYDGYSYTCNLNTYQILIMHIAYKEDYDDDGSMLRNVVRIFTVSCTIIPNRKCNIFFLNDGHFTIIPPFSMPWVIPFGFPYLTKFDQAFMVKRLRAMSSSV